MSWRNVPDSERDRLLNLQDNNNLTEADAKSAQMPLETLKRRLREWRRKRAYDLEQNISRYRTNGREAK